MELSEFSLQFTKQDIHAVQIGRNYYATNPAVETIQPTINRDVFAKGIFLGEDKGKFIPSPALIDIIAKQPDAKNKVVINKKAEWLFLCGKNILEESVIGKLPPEETLVLVQNEADENLGFGVIKKEDVLIIKNILDKGFYLRVEDKKGHKKR